MHKKGIPSRLQTTFSAIVFLLTTSSITEIALQSRVIAIISSDPFIGAADVVNVEVNYGVVDIGGIVETWEQHRRVTHDAFRAGAKTVVNHLRVREDPLGSERRFVYRHDPFSKHG